MSNTKVEIPQEEIDKGKGLAWLSYWGILFLVPLLAQRDNRYSQFHAKQGLALFILWIAWYIVFGILLYLFFSFLPFISILFTIIFWLGIVALAIIALIGFIQALMGKVWKLPFGIGDLAEKFKF